MPIEKGHSPEVETRTTYHLIQMANRRRKLLEVARLNKDKKFIAIHGRELHALSWALDRLGYPPSRYQEVVDRYRGRFVARRPIDPPTRESTPVPAEVVRSRRLWQQVREEEGF